LILGDFTITPSNGTVPVGGVVKLNVEFNAENGGTAYEVLCVDVSDRDPSDQPDGIPFELLAESCVPGINTTDLGSIFEEQQIVKRLDATKIKSNVYAVDDHTFMFYSVVLGQVSEERVKIANISKVPCTVNISVQGRRGGKDDKEATFDVKPKKLAIGPQEYSYVTISFRYDDCRFYWRSKFLP
jgi:hypothetical protein